MTGKFTISEILIIALKIEEYGKDFYKQYSEISGPEETGKTFMLLSKEEQIHYDKYKAILDSLKQKELKINYPGDVSFYLKALAEESIFNESKKVETALKLKSEKEVLEFALKLEHDSIKFYEIMKRTIPLKNRKTVSTIINEEKEHVEIINNMLHSRN
ncbi:MAG: ferritin family protein [Actinobacteria bacterium]|nr:ferritin family protein [Actinomycetota bacterium]